MSFALSKFVNLTVIKVLDQLLSKADYILLSVHTAIVSVPLSRLIPALLFNLKRGYESCLVLAVDYTHIRKIILLNACLAIVLVKILLKH